MLFILIAFKAKALASTALVMILIAYALGWLGMQYAGVHPESDFYGRFIMMGYFGVCLVGIVWQWWANNRANQRANQQANQQANKRAAAVTPT